MVRSLLRYYAWTLASWTAAKLSPIQKNLPREEEDDDTYEGADGVPASLTEEGWEMLSQAAARTTTSEPPTPLAGSLAARLRRETP